MPFTFNLTELFFFTTLFYIFSLPQYFLCLCFLLLILYCFSEELVRLISYSIFFNPKMEDIKSFILL